MLSPAQFWGKSQNFSVKTNLKTPYSGSFRLSVQFIPFSVISPRGELAAKTSYPCGAQAFSRGLQSVPQFSLLTVSFWGSKSPSALLEAGPRLTVEFTYHQRPPTISTPDAGYHAEWRGPAWEIAVHPLLSRHRKLFMTWLETEGFALASDWLRDSWHFHGRDGRAAFEFHLDNSTGLITQSASEEVMPFR